MEIYTVSCIGNLLRKYVDCSWTFATAYLVHSIKYSCQWILEMAFLGMPVLTVVSLEEKKTQTVFLPSIGNISECEASFPLSFCPSDN